MLFIHYFSKWKTVEHPFLTYHVLLASGSKQNKYIIITMDKMNSRSTVSHLMEPADSVPNLECTSGLEHECGAMALCRLCKLRSSSASHRAFSSALQWADNAEPFSRLKTAHAMLNNRKVMPHRLRGNTIAAPPAGRDILQEGGTVPAWRGHFQMFWASLFRVFCLRSSAPPCNSFPKMILWISSSRYRKCGKKLQSAGCRRLRSSVWQR